MNDGQPQGTTLGREAGMGGRIRRLLLQPKLEWAAIDAEPMTVRGIMLGWAVPLAAIGPVANLIGSLVFGYGAFGIVYRPSVATAVSGAIVSYILALLAVWVLSLVINGLASTFDGVPNPVAAMKVAAFSATASWLAGIFQILPTLSFLAIVGLYSLYLLYLGLPRLMRAPESKALVYTIVTIVAAAVLFAVVGAITTRVVASTASPVLAGPTGTVSVGGVDLAKAAASMDAANHQAQTATAVPPATLAAMLPAAIGGWTRREIESSGGAAAGIGGASATARYVQGDNHMTLAVTDLGAMGGLAALGSAMNVESSKQTATGYEKTSKVDGRMTSEKWDTSSHSGEYNTLVANRFTVDAEGSAADPGQLKAAVGAVDLGKLAALASH